MLGMLREVQIPLLAALLLCGCLAKVRRAVAARSASAGTGPTVLFPLHLHRPAAVGLCGCKLGLGLGLLLTAGRTGAGGPALAVRVATGLLFAVAVGALQELRARRPEAGCGCFGELSRTPVSWRVITRAAALCAAALCSVGAQPLRRPSSPGQAWLTLAAAAAELALLAVLSPEVGELLTGWGIPTRASCAKSRCRGRCPRCARALPGGATASSWPPGRLTSGGRAAGVSWSSPACWTAAGWRWCSPSTWPAAGRRSVSAD
jgi:hypothetical protein